MPLVDIKVEKVDVGIDAIPPAPQPTTVAKGLCAYYKVACKEFLN